MRTHPRAAWLLATMLTAILPVTAVAGPASERVFSTTALDMMTTDDAAVYTHTREGAPVEGFEPLDNGEIRVTLGTDSQGNREAAVTMGTAGKLRPVSAWPASSGNPILPIFLESTLRAMAAKTGGSAFYIRNRIKEALGTGGTVEDIRLDVAGAEVPVKRIVFDPFKNDKNRERMGPFADMTLRFYVSDKVPGDIVRFVATTGEETGEAAYRETIAFQSLKKGD